jgi:hypothetical protein
MFSADAQGSHLRCSANPLKSCQSLLEKQGARGKLLCCAVRQVRSARFPIIAEVSGLATAGGCQLVAACDLAIAAENSTFSTPGVRQADFSQLCLFFRYRFMTQQRRSHSKAPLIATTPWAGSHRAFLHDTRRGAGQGTADEGSHAYAPHGRGDDCGGGPCPCPPTPFRRHNASGCD